MEEAVKTFLTNVFKCYLDWIPEDVRYIYKQMYRIADSLYENDHLSFTEYNVVINNLQSWYMEV